MTKELNKGLRENAERRSKGAVDQIRQVQRELELELASGKLASRFDEHGELQVNSRDISLMAGLGKHFLYGKKHRNTTLTDVEDFLLDLAKRFRRQKPVSTKSIAQHHGSQASYDESSEDRIVALQSELDELKRRYSKLADYTDAYSKRARRLQLENRYLKEQMRPTVVAIAPKS